MSGKTFFSRESSCLFPIIPEDRRIPATDFLAAAEMILPFFDKLGTGFSVIKNDLGRNIQSLKKKHAMNPELFTTIDAMLEDEVDKPKVDLAKVAALWLKRGLDFVSTYLELFVKNRDDGLESTQPYLSEAYTRILKQYHGFILQKLFAGLSRMVEYKKVILKNMKEDTTIPDDVVYADLEIYIKLLRENITVLDEILKKLNFDSDKKV
ncbi:hypothetical protein SNE40_002583 [Patella caerulea]|uniref:Glycolipid transfer protein domain-containing protein n=1 Tax=Patella caerulea TaxID=87958 RepID=A0AAN8KG40_PATCE